jgi:hypothetical protein
MGLMWGKATGYTKTHYFLYLCIGKRRIQLFRWRVKNEREMA